MKHLSKITKHNIKNAMILSEAEGNSKYIDIEGLIFEKLTMSGEDYAKSINAIPYNESIIFKM